MRKVVFFLSALLLLSCNDKREPIRIKDWDEHIKPPEPKADSIQVLDHVLIDLCENQKVKSIINRLDPVGLDTLNLMVSERLYMVDSVLIEQLIQAGGPESIRGYNHARGRTFGMLVDILSDVGRIDVTCMPPLNQREIELYVGGVNFSKVLLDEEHQNAMVLAHFQRFREKNTEVFCFYKLKKNKDSWQIEYKLCPTY